MATTLIVQHTPIPSAPTTTPLSNAPLTIDITKFKSPKPPVPNKHIPYCSPGPAPNGFLPQTPSTPPDSPPTKYQDAPLLSILYPPEKHTKINDSPPVYSISASTLASAMEQYATQPLSEAKQVFPWLHGLHPDNHMQLGFFAARRKITRKTPACIRGLTILKAKGNLGMARLKGAISSKELLTPAGVKAIAFNDVDPREGFSVRNFQIQTTKMATVSDIVIYGDRSCTEHELHVLAKRVAVAQRVQREKRDPGSLGAPVYNTFVVIDPFSTFERDHPELVAVDSEGKHTDQVVDFFQLERQEMSALSKASEIAHNVWIGPTRDPSAPIDPDDPVFDISIEASDLAQPLDLDILNKVAEMSLSAPQEIEFPSSGSILPPTWSHNTVDGLLDTLHWIHALANPEMTPDPSEDGSCDGEGDVHMKIVSPQPRKVFIHCMDGYTETSMLALAYIMFAECLPVHEAWTKLHVEKKRNFFAYPSDVSLLTSIQPRLMQESPLSRGQALSSLPIEPAWKKQLDGSLPSRILPYMYLGNLAHANNPDLLKILGIHRVLSIGEPVNWANSPKAQDWGPDRLLLVNGVQDNGVDPLMNEFERCLEFIAKGKEEGTATLVHCRVGVSRSATICIAEVMASMGYSFPRAYCFVRARRLNVIIQPHLRFAYELLKWEELQRVKRGQPLRRELEWPTIAREIAAMNKPYTKC